MRENASPILFQNDRDGIFHRITNYDAHQNTGHQSQPQFRNRLPSSELRLDSSLWGRLHGCSPSGYLTPSTTTAVPPLVFSFAIRHWRRPSGNSCLSFAFLPRIPHYFPSGSSIKPHSRPRFSKGFSRLSASKLSSIRPPLPMYYFQQPPGIGPSRPPLPVYYPDNSPWSHTYHSVLGSSSSNAYIWMPPRSPGYPLPAPHPHMPIQTPDHHLPFPPHQQNQHPMDTQNNSQGCVTAAQPIMTQRWEDESSEGEVRNPDSRHSFGSSWIIPFL